MRRKITLAINVSVPDDVEVYVVMDAINKILDELVDRLPDTWAVQEATITKVTKG